VRRRATRSTSARGGRLVTLVITVVVTCLSMPQGVAGVSGSTPERPMDFAAETFPLADLPARLLPFQTDVDPTIPPDWTPTDRQGIVMREIDGKRYYHPLLLCYSAFRLINAYERTHTAGYLTWARRYAAKMLELAVASDGALFMPYRFDFLQSDVRAPWFSGMAQGMTLTVFVRMYRLTHEPTYLATAHQLFRSFQRSGPTDRPWVSRVSNRNELWIEEYPIRSRPDRVLNGFMFAIYGLYEFWQLTRTPASRHYLEGALTTLKRHVMEYRVPGGISYYSLRKKAQYEHYHFVHITMLREIRLMSGDPYFGEVAALFKQDHPRPRTS
jgi:hypothetical protein